MKLRNIAAVCLALLLGVSFLGAQTELLATRDGATVNVQRAKAIGEILSGKPHYVHVIAKHQDGSVFADVWTHNLRTTGGADWQSNAMAATSSVPATGNYIALTNDATAPAAGDCAAGSTACTLTSEIAANGLSRAQGTYAHSNGTASYTVTKTFTATGTQSAQKAAIFNAASSGTMIFEATFTSVTLANGDTLTVQWTVSI